MASSIGCPCLPDRAPICKNFKTTSDFQYTLGCAQQINGFQSHNTGFYEWVVRMGLRHQKWGKKGFTVEQKFLRKSLT